MEDGVPGANDGGLYADVAWAKARARAIRCASIERDTDQGDVEFLGLGDVREAHKGRDASETGEAKSV